MRMRLFAAAVSCAALCASAKAADQCRIQQFPAFHITMNGLRPLVQARINGLEARFIVDSGAFLSMVSPAAAVQYKLPTEPASPEFYLTGVNGNVRPDIANVETFSLLGVNIRHVLFLVGGNDYSSGAAGLLGENVLHLADMEYDLAHGLMRFVKAENCRGPELAYWASGQAVSAVDLQRIDFRNPHLIGTVGLGGRAIPALFDTGAPHSMLDVAAAKRAGIGPGDPGVVPAGFVGGIAQRPIRIWIAAVPMLQIGSEKIEHTRVLVGDFNPAELGADMLLGADFFLAHHVYVSKAYNRLYFTYNGGPVFNLGQAGATARAGASGDAAGAPAGAPVSADELRRRGMAAAARMQYALALSDLDRACQLDPRNADCLTQRGKVYGWAGRPQRALADFDAALQLQPDDIDAHLLRARLRMFALAPLAAASPGKPDAAVLADLAAVDRLSTPEAQVRLELGQLYDQVGRYADGIHQIDTWLRFHADDAQLPVAWNARCWMRAESNQDLAGALKDCDRAIKRHPGSADFLDSRGLVDLRLHRFHRALADYDAALRIDPRVATALYGRGLAEQRLGDGRRKAADLAAAVKIDSRVGSRFGEWGMTP